ncbi:hypothetical protein OM076_37670 [Solirubrobacter ginsenosidimutans]|uniref:Uncharacterized protein n=1 Tax=Solirubrobacter ginsenosidimutans TaxID=490573 RepID=A0A9X3N2X5_9ACTN|nr:hypothetical protein [Solirubrobacter ginsenosidimutans]MDA0166055.1 hypothetical protein [Solirubrobacter ginsenosidimutans]
MRQDLRITREVPAAYRLHHRDLAEREITHHEGIPIISQARAARPPRPRRPSSSARVR